MLIVDAHLDLSMNAMEWNRDPHANPSMKFAPEKKHDRQPDRGKGVVNFE